jgi:hypothetical protein
MTDHDWELRLPFQPIPIAPDQAATWADRITFDQCAVLASNYYSIIASRAPTDRVELARELAELIKQLDFLLKSVYVLHSQYFRLMATTERPSLDYRLQRHSGFAIDLYTTAFYYLAHRAQVIAVGRKHSLPGFANYRQAVGVRTTRNAVVEHPRPEDFATVSAFTLHSHHGSKSRAMRDGKGVSSDPRGWLFPEATELEASLREVLLRAHQHLGFPPPQAVT